MSPEPAMKVEPAANAGLEDPRDDSGRFSMTEQGSDCRDGNPDREVCSRACCSGGAQDFGKRLRLKCRGGESWYRSLINARGRGVFLGARNAHSVLKRFPRANGFLEEIRQGTIERECIEEVCSYEEVKEVFENKEKTMEFWKGYTNYVYSVKDPGHSMERSDAVYVVVPLLGAALLIVIALFIIWRCQLQKATRHRPSYAQSRYLASRTGRSLPRVMVYRERSQSQGETQYQREASNRAAGDGRAGGTPQQDSTLYPPEHSVSVLSRLSSATPPPSYEEVTGHPESSSGEETSVSYNDPPPKYEEIVASAPAVGK